MDKKIDQLKQERKKLMNEYYAIIEAQRDSQQQAQARQRKNEWALRRRLGDCLFRHFDDKTLAKVLIHGSEEDRKWVKRHFPDLAKHW